MEDFPKVAVAARKHKSAPTFQANAQLTAFSLSFIAKNDLCYRHTLLIKSAKVEYMGKLHEDTQEATIYYGKAADEGN